MLSSFYQLSGLCLLACTPAVLAQNAGIFLSTYVAPVNIEEQGPLVPSDYQKYRPIFNDYGFAIRGNTTDGEDFSLWLFMYRQTGVEEVIIDGDIMQLAFQHGHFSGEERQRMHDTPSVNVGQSLEDYYPVGEIKQAQDSKEATWDAGNITLSYDGRNVWRATGTHAGITVDITMKNTTDQYYHIAPFEKLQGCSAKTASENYHCSGKAGGIIHMSATGTIAYNKTVQTLDQAYGVHERIIMSNEVASRVSTSQGSGGSWLHSWGSKFTFFVFGFDAGKGGYATKSMVNIDGESYVSAAFNNQNATLAAKDVWLDPKSHQVTTTAWDVNVFTPVGHLVSAVTGFGRLYYYWVRAGGLIITQQMIAEATATFTYNNGTVVSEKQFAFIEAFRTMYIATPNGSPEVIEMGEMGENADDILRAQQSLLAQEL